MLAHKRGLGLETLVRIHLFIALIVILAQSKLKEYPKKGRKGNNKIGKAHIHTVLLCKRCDGIIESDPKEWRVDKWDLAFVIMNFITVKTTQWWKEMLYNILSSFSKEKAYQKTNTTSFFFFLFYFLTLQYCIGFAVYQNESATGIHVFPILNPPPSPYHPSGSSQCTSPKHPVLCIEPGLATFHTWYFTCFNAILPNHPTLSLSHRVQKTVLYISVSLAVLYTGLLLPSF